MPVDKTLTVQRGQLKASLTRFQTYLEKLEGQDSISVKGLERRLALFEPVLEQFNKIQSTIEQSDETEFNEGNAKRIEFEDTYHSLLDIAVDLIEANNVPAVNAVSNTDSQNRQNAATDQIAPNNDNSNETRSVLSQPLSAQIRLPRIELPKFDGSYEQWFPFYNMFSSLIHCNLDLSEIQKFHYLKSCLQEDAKTALDSLELSSENYSVAWELLNTRYDNKRIIVRNHIRALFDIPPASKESSVGLRRIVDETRKHTQALRALKRPLDNCDDLLVHLVASKIDTSTNKEWENIQTNEHPTVEQMLKFLDRKCQTLESIIRQQPGNQQHIPVKPRKAFSHASSQLLCCVLCGKNHVLQNCETFLGMPVERRFAEIKGRKLCLNCFKSNHSTFRCSASRCHLCSKKHNSLLHFSTPSIHEPSKPKPSNVRSTAAQADSLPEINNVPSTSIDTNHAVFYAHGESDVLLSTALVNIADVDGKLHVCRALLDSGSQSNFISADLQKRLNLPLKKTHITITGVNQSSSSVSHSTQIRVFSRYNSFCAKMTCLILNKVTENIPLTSVDRAQCRLPVGIKLADPEFNVSRPIELLIGADTFWDLMCVGQLKSIHHPLLQKTQFGWVAAGRIGSRKRITKSSSNFCTVDTVNKSLEKFWALEDSFNSKCFTKEETTCENHFKSTFGRSSDGRFIVQLPFKEDPISRLGDSKEQALNRFYSLEKRLRSQHVLREQYTKFMEDYLALGHMRQVVTQGDSGSAFYLPHHAVLKEGSLTTRLRVVFDASAKGSNGTSLNDVLMVGPTLQEDIFSILLRFRKHKFVLSADITKMYRQVLLHPSQTRYHRIFWRNNPEDDLLAYELQTVTYGTAPASFLAVRCLQQLSVEHATSYPLGAAVINRDFYMDDLLTGANTEKEALKIRDQVISILSSGGFELRKWSSNNKTLLKGLPDKMEAAVLHLDKDETTKTLGLLWNPSLDIFQFSIPQIDSKRRVTKRSILSDISQVFDPLGLINPIIVSAKILMQKLWLLKTDWDESVPTDVYTSWFFYRTQLRELNSLVIPRLVLPLVSSRSLQIHGFCDASPLAYGACIYIRSLCKTGSVNTSLLCSKSRVAPLKSISLARLELCGALLLARLASKVLDSLKIGSVEKFFWTDSKIVLAWLSASSNKWTTFVANRVGEIQLLTEICDWHHVRTLDNPADILTRGATPHQLLESNQWWNGPSWLDSDIACWPISNAPIDFTGIPEERRVAHVVANKEVEVLPYARFSSFSRLIRAVAYCLRFCANCKLPKQRRSTGPLVSDELRAARRAVVKNIQRIEFCAEIRSLEKGAPIENNSKLLCLNPFLDNDGLIRVGGRIKHSRASYSVKHPLLMPGKHSVTQLLIRHFHINRLHAGTEGTLAAIRQQYWPIACRSVVRNVVRQCVQCFRAKPRFSQQIMGDLPKQRVVPGRPFMNCCVDYCGPFYYKGSNRRNTPSQKAYAAIFVCCSTKAVHCEIVSDLTSDAFIAALRRLMARRGKVSTMYSDNGTNFVGANKELKRLHLQHMKDYGKISEAFAEDGLTWSFIPPSSPHFGGLWEAAVKSVKRHLKIVAGNASLNFEELSTLLTQVESILNSRPITPLSSDPNDLSFLTPGHFLIGCPLTDCPQERLSDVTSNRLSKWERVEKIRQHFWSRWQREYLLRFQQRTKWKQSGGAQPFEGQMVIIRDDQLPPLRWLMGRIVAVHPGKDGVVRVATVRTQTGEIKRAIAKLCALPIEQ